MSLISLQAILVILLVSIPVLVFSDDTVLVPADKSKLNIWFDDNVKPYTERKDSLDPELAAAEANRKVIKVNGGGGGDFKTITDAVKSIPDGNKNRIIISIAPGNYTEMVKIGRYTPFITFYGEDPKNMPTLVFGGTAAEFGTVYSGTLTVESDYFNLINMNIVNSAPRPDGERVGAQAVALAIRANKAAIYNCRIYGYQDTLLDDFGKHLYKDCYVEGTVDFIFGSAKTLYLNTEIHVIPGDPMAIIAAHSRKEEKEDSGYSFVHCEVTGTGKNAYLGRSWQERPRVVYSYTIMSDAVHPEGWSNNHRPETEKTVFFGEYNNKGPGAEPGSRAKFAKQLSDAEAKPFLTLGYIEASKWLLRPTEV